MRTILIIAEIILVVALAREMIKREVEKGWEYFLKLEEMYKYTSKVYDRYKEYLCGDEDFIYEDWATPHFEPDFDDEMKQFATDECNKVRLLQETLDLLKEEISELRPMDTMFRCLRHKFNKKYGKAFMSIRAIEKDLNFDDRITQLLKAIGKVA